MSLPYGRIVQSAFGVVGITENPACRPHFYTQTAGNHDESCLEATGKLSVSEFPTADNDYIFDVPERTNLCRTRTSHDASGVNARLDPSITTFAKKARVDPGMEARKGVKQQEPSKCQIGRTSPLKSSVLAVEGFDTARGISTIDAKPPLESISILSSSAQSYSYIMDMSEILKRAIERHRDLGAQLAATRLNRIRAEQQKASFVKRLAYLKECQAAADREERLTLQKITALRTSLAAADNISATPSARPEAVQELDSVVSGRGPRSGDGLKLADTTYQNTKNNDAKATTILAGTDNTLKDKRSRKDVVSGLRVKVSPLPTSATTLLTPPNSPESSAGAYSSDRIHTPSSHEKKDLPSTAAEFENKLDIIPRSSAQGVSQLSDSTGAAYENPIGPYVRPPMSIDDMQKCIRCLLSKDKSLKTGNYARVFLGEPWSKIVSFDPDILLARGVSGIKEGSTGMASRLRMMTIIESALANQNNDAITADIWERPTFFCEGCQERYPTTVDSDNPVATFEQLERSGAARDADGACPKTTTTSVKHRNGDNTAVPTSENQDATLLKRKRPRKKSRGSRVDLTSSAAAVSH